VSALPAPRPNLINYGPGRLVEDNLRFGVGRFVAVPATLRKGTGDRRRLFGGLGHQSADGSLIIPARAPAHLVDEAAICELGNQRPVPAAQGLPVIPLGGEAICFLAPLFGRLCPVLVCDRTTFCSPGSGENVEMEDFGPPGKRRTPGDDQDRKDQERSPCSLQKS